MRKAELAGAAQSAEPEVAAPLAARAARARAHAVTVVSVAQKMVAPLVTRAARTQTARAARTQTARKVQRLGGKAVLPHRACLGWAQEA